VSAPTFDIIAIGNAIVDVISQADDAFIEREEIAKGSMPDPRHARCAAHDEHLPRRLAVPAGRRARS
jgi:sugar/nucleoside kinase (ribokinase family)